MKELNWEAVATNALKIGKVFVKGTKDMKAYHIGKCLCPLEWNAFDASLIIGTAQGFVAHMMRHHGESATNAPLPEHNLRTVGIELMKEYLVEWVRKDRTLASPHQQMLHQEELACHVHTFVNGLEDAPEEVKTNQCALCDGWTTLLCRSCDGDGCEACNNKGEFPCSICNPSRPREKNNDVV